MRLRHCFPGKPDRRRLVPDRRNAGADPLRHVTNIVCTQPFGCLPNHVVGKGVIKELRHRYPHVQYCCHRLRSRRQRSQPVKPYQTDAFHSPEKSGKRRDRRFQKGCIRNESIFFPHAGHDHRQPSSAACWPLPFRFFLEIFSSSFITWQTRLLPDTF